MTRSRREGGGPRRPARLWAAPVRASGRAATPADQRRARGTAPGQMHRPRARLWKTTGQHRMPHCRRLPETPRGQRSWSRAMYRAWHKAARLHRQVLRPRTLCTPETRPHAGYWIEGSSRLSMSFCFAAAQQCSLPGRFHSLVKPVLDASRKTGPAVFRDMAAPRRLHGTLSYNLAFGRVNRSPAPS